MDGKLDRSRTRLSPDFLSKMHHPLHGESPRFRCQGVSFPLQKSQRLSTRDKQPPACSPLYSAHGSSYVTFKVLFLEQEHFLLTASYTNAHQVKQIKTAVHREIQDRRFFSELQGSMEQHANPPHPLSMPFPGIWLSEKFLLKAWFLPPCSPGEFFLLAST